MDSTSEFVAFALVFVAIGAAIWSLMFAANWWLAPRRAGQADRLRATEGILNAVAPRHVEFAGKAAAASHWTVDARYDYGVEATRYAGDRFALEFNSWYPDETSAVAAASRFRPGDTVTVWYDPDLPATAVLDKTPPSRRTYYRNFALAAFGIAVVAAVATVVVIAGHAAEHRDQRRAIRLAGRSSLG